MKEIPLLPELSEGFTITGNPNSLIAFLKSKKSLHILYFGIETLLSNSAFRINALLVANKAASQEMVFNPKTAPTFATICIGRSLHIVNIPSTSSFWAVSRTRL